MDLTAIFRKNYGSFRRFFSMLAKAHLPYLWLAAYIASSFVITNIGVSTTEYSAQLFAGSVGLWTVVLPYLFFRLLSLVIGSVTGILSALCSARIDRNLRRMIWRKTVQLPLSFYEANEPKELISRVTTDTTAISQLVMQVFIAIITSAYSTVVILRRIASYDGALMWSLLVVLPVNVLINFILGRMKFGLQDLVNQRKAQLTGVIAERTNHMMLVKTMGTQAKERAAGTARMEASYRASVMNAWVVQLAWPVNAIAGALQVIVIIMAGRGYYASGDLSLAEWIAYYGFATQLTNIFSAYLGYWTSFKAAQGATDRVSQIMDMPSEEIEAGETVTDLSGDIRLEKVTFSYGETPFIQDLDLTIPAGKITAIVGPSGSGKSTILNLIDRLYRIQGGTITIGGRDTAACSLASYRKAMGYVTQECVMYSGTIRDNLLHGLDRRPTDSEMDRACAASGILEYVRSQPQGYETPVSESGASLSGGQRQRFSVARALLKQPDCLLLDEATAAMDVDGKDRVWAGIREVMARKTVIFVAHDAQTLQNADYLIVLRDGKVEAAGARDQILRTNPYCKEMMEQEDRG